MKTPISLKKDLTWILAVKIALIVAIKLIFFGTPLRPDGPVVARHFFQEQPSQGTPPGDSAHE